MKDELVKALTTVLKELGVENVTPTVERAGDLAHGDYTSNVAMVLAKVLKRKPVEIAEEIKNKLTGYRLQVTAKGQDTISKQSGQKGSVFQTSGYWLQDIDRVDVVVPGFINFHLSASNLSKAILQVLEAKEVYGTSQSHNGKKIMVEFAHPNTHKAFHIGHLRNITTGESLIRLFESQGIEVIRVNYQGDVGMHIAKALYALLRIDEFKNAMQKYSSSEARSKDDSSHSIKSGSNDKILKEKVELLGKAYAAGSAAFEDPSADGEKAKETIKDINYLIYASVQRFNKERNIEPSTTDYMKFVQGRAVEVDQIYELWKETRQWSLDYFDSIYKRVGTTYDRFYFESECLSGVDIAKDAVKKGILKESEGAIIFDGKPHGLDTRVFVNSLGLPTYEGKELALAKKEFSEYGRLDKLIHVLGREQVSFTQVTFKVQELLGIQKDQQLHLVYGWVKLKHGKMSSRTGNVVLGEWLLEEAKKAILEILDKSSSRHAELGSASKALEIPKQVRDDDLGQQSRYTEVQKNEIAEKAAVAAIKYSFLRVGTLSEIAFDLEESINFNGDSGPYIQYTYARCKSVLRKVSSVIPAKAGIRSEKKTDPHSSIGVEDKLREDDTVSAIYIYNDEEKRVLRLIRQFPEVVTAAAENYAPSAVAKYLYDLAGAFNTFYNKHTILGFAQKTQNSELRTQNFEESGSKGKEIDKRTSEFRLRLTEATAQVLKNGLYLLGIETLEQM